MSIFKDSEASAYVSSNAIVVDSTGGGHYTAIEDAISYANTLTITGGRVLILVRPGAYTVNNTSAAIAINSGITLAGELGTYPTVSKTSNANALFTSTTSGNVYISGLTISGPTSNACIELKSTASTDIVENCIFTAGREGILCSGAVSSIFQIKNCLMASCTDGIKITAGATVLIENTTTQGCTTGIHTTVAGATALMNGCTSLGDTLAWYGDGSSASTLVGIGCCLINVTNAIKVDNGCPVFAVGCVIQAATNDVNQANATSIVMLSGCLANPDQFTITGAGLDVFYVDIVDFNNGNKRVKRRDVGVNSTLAKGDDMISLTAAGLTLTLPALAGESSSFPLTYWIHNQDSGTQTITANAADTINGSGGGGSYTLAARAGVRLVGFGTTWFVG